MIHATRLAAAVLRLRMCQIRGGRSMMTVRGAVIANPMPAGISVLVVGSGPEGTTGGKGAVEFILLGADNV